VELSQGTIATPKECFQTGRDCQRSVIVRAPLSIGQLV